MNDILRFVMQFADTRKQLAKLKTRHGKKRTPSRREITMGKFAYCPECDTVLAKDVDIDEASEESEYHTKIECGMAVTGDMQDFDRTVKAFRDAFL